MSVLYRITIEKILIITSAAKTIESQTCNDYLNRVGGMQECLKDCSRDNRSDDQSYYHTYRRSNKIAEVNMVVFTSVLSEKIENIKSSIFDKKQILVVSI